MYDEEAETRYEIEVMLGAVDESHIIRAIEYWDVERQRYPTLEHRAVIVADQITARFFNVIRLLNRAIPMVAIQLSAFVLDDSIVLHFTRVLDTYEFGADIEDPPGDVADRGYWEKRASRESLELLDSLLPLVPTAHGEPRVTYNRGHIALGTSGYNFCWLHPRRASPHCNLHMKVPPDQRPSLIEKLEGVGIDAANRGRTSVRLQLTKKDITENRSALEELLRVAEELSQR